MVTVIYIDTLFLLNLVVDYLLLLASARLAGKIIRRGRIALAALLGAGYAAAIFMPGLGFLAHPLCKLGAAVIMALTAFGGSRRLLRLLLVFLGLSCALGGCVLAVGLLGGQGLTLRSGVIYSAMDLKLVLLSSAVCYAVFTLVFQRTARHGSRELVPAVLTIGEHRVVLTALVDTGNTLTDPMTGRPVMVVEGEKMAAVLPGTLKKEELQDPVSAMERLSGKEEGRRFRLLPYQTVGVECGMLLAVRLDRAMVGTKDLGDILAALSPNCLSDGGGYSALIGAKEWSA